jgi:predicted helicase
MFNHIAGPELDERITWVVDDLAELLHRARMDLVLENFGRRTRREDPVVHFYETFLSAYDPLMRDARGVYYTPEPVVSYIVRSVDHVLKAEFGLPDGLADNSKVAIKTAGSKGAREVHRVQILDPATGTGTFLAGVVDLVHEAFLGNQGMWPGYVHEHLLPRLYGFELLMAPYAIAHLKLGMRLKESGYNVDAGERLGIYLTNSLEPAHESEDSQLSFFATWLAEEAAAASDVKRDAPVMVVLGNPPYAGISSNRSDTMLRLVDAYRTVDGEPLGERKLWLQDDYVKFIRLGQTRIERTGHGILALITNHGYLDNPTFRGMRRSLMQAFDKIYVLNLHGGRKKRESCPDGSPDENIFVIQPGIAIGIFVRTPNAKRSKGTLVRYGDCWGTRQTKYDFLASHDLSDTDWQTVRCETPRYYFVPSQSEHRDEYEAYRRLDELMPVHGTGIVTARDELTLAFSKDELQERLRSFSELDPEEARTRFNLRGDVRDWRVGWAQEDLRQSGLSRDLIHRALYRPFDYRFTYYTGTSRGFIGQPAKSLMSNMLGCRNVALITVKRFSRTGEPTFFFASRDLVISGAIRSDNQSIDIVFPLMLASRRAGDSTTSASEVNLQVEAVGALGEALRLTPLESGVGDLTTTFGPEDLFHYIYSIVHAPSYRSRYAAFLCADFPRIPFTSDRALFAELCSCGKQLMALHLMEAAVPPVTKYPVPGQNYVETVRYVPPVEGPRPGRVWINGTQYFEGVPSEVWGFRVGSYRVCDKWLRLRRGRMLSFDELSTYQQIVATLARTRGLMGCIDGVIQAHGGWPIH